MFESIAFLFLELILVTAILLFLYRLKPRFGLVFVFIFVASNQYLQTILANTVFLKISDEIILSPGSVVLFSSSLFATLLIYIKDGVNQARTMIYGIAISNISLILLTLITKHQIGLESFQNTWNLPPTFFNLNIRLFITGTVLLLLDSILLIIIYDFLSLKFSRIHLFLRICFSLISIMIFDSVLFTKIGFWDWDGFPNLLYNNLIGKMIVGTFFAAITYLYLLFDQKKEQTNVLPYELKDIFSIITYKERYEQIKKEKEKLELLNKDLNETNDKKVKFFSVLSHDLKSPFTAIVGFSELLNEEIDQLSKQDIKEYANYILQSSKNGLELFQHIMEWSKLQLNQISFEPEIVDLSQIISKSIQLLQPNIQGKKLTIRFNEMESKVFGDRNMLFSVVQNLLSNAIKFSYPENNIVISLVQNKKESIVIVEDFGVGISTENVKKLFNSETHYTSYGTQKEKGTGLGLMISKGFVDKHLGKLWVISELGKGSQFYFSIPKKNTY